jgi:hypothetical protein
MLVAAVELCVSDPGGGRERSTVARLRDALDSLTDPTRRPGDRRAAARALLADHLGFDRGAEPGLPAAWPDRTGAVAADAVGRRDGRPALVVELESLSREAERAVVRAVDAPAPALFAFHDAAASRWHLVSADASAGRVAVRRFCLGPDRTHRRAAAALAPLADGGPVAERLADAFDWRRVRDAFHDAYREAFERVRDSYGRAGVDAAVPAAHDTLTRLLYVAFRDAGRGDALTRLADLAEPDATGSLHGWLRALFDRERRAALPARVAAASATVPPLHDGVLGSAGSPPATLPDDLLADVVSDLVDDFAFAPVEVTAEDVDLAVTPSVLGSVHESLLTATERGESGVFYTPPAVVDDVCRVALFDHLTARVADEERDAIRGLVFDGDAPPAETADAVRAALSDVRVVDPACGAGAFLVGVLRLLCTVSERVGDDDATLARTLVDDALHGVDVAAWAVRVAAVRLELAVAAAGEDAAGLEPPLFVGDSLRGPVRDGISAGDALDRSAAAAPDQSPDAAPGRALDDAVADGFDLVIGNPPYVPHQGIDPPADADPTDATAAEYRTALQDDCEAAWGVRPDRRSDLYVYFFFRGVASLAPGGTLAFLTSNAWLDVGYGGRLQAFLLASTDLRRVVATGGRAFPDAEVNVALTCLHRPTGGRPTLDGDVAFLAPTPPAGSLVGPRGDALLAGREGRTVTYRDERLEIRTTSAGRTVRVARASLWRLGGGDVDDGAPDGRYGGATWGALLLRAPDCFFTLVDRDDGALVRLDGDRIETYLNTGGADEFFVLDVVDRSDGHVTVATPDGRFEIESEYAVPFLRSPRSLDRLRVTSEAVSSHLLAIPRDVPRARLDSQAVGAYLAWGESVGFDSRSGTSARSRWEVLPSQAHETAPVLVGCYMSEPRVFYNPERIVSHRFFRYYPAANRDPLLLVASLNSAVTLLSYELFRNPGLGGGVLAVGTDAIERFLVVDPDAMDLDRETASSFLDRPQESLDEELGFDPDRPLSAQRPDPKPDRRAVDEGAFDALSLTEAERVAVYRGLASLRRDRRHGR